MQCGVCGADNNFCGACGASLAVADERRADAPAGFWTRFAAFAIDLVLMVLIAQFFGTLSTIITITVGSWLEFIPAIRELQLGLEQLLSYYYVALFAATIVYFTLGVSVWGTTVGKRAAGMYVVAEDGSDVGGGRSLARAVVMVLSIASVVGLVASAVTIAAREDKRGLNDVICGTMVVRR